MLLILNAAGRDCSGNTIIAQAWGDSAAAKHQNRAT